MSKFSELYFEPHPNWHLPGRKKVPPRGATAVGAVGQNGWVDKPKDKQEVVKQPGWGDVSLDKKRVHGLKHPSVNHVVPFLDEGPRRAAPWSSYIDDFQVPELPEGAGRAAAAGAFDFEDSRHNHWEGTHRLPAHDMHDGRFENRPHHATAPGPEVGYVPKVDLHSGRWQGRAMHDTDVPAATGRFDAVGPGVGEGAERGQRWAAEAGPNEGRWERRGQWGERTEVVSRHPVDPGLHEGRWEGRVEPGKGVRPLAEDRAPSIATGHNAGHYDKDGLWVSNRFQERAKWAHEAPPQYMRMQPNPGRWAQGWRRVENGPQRDFDLHDGRWEERAGYGAEARAGFKDPREFDLPTNKYEAGPAAPREALAEVEALRKGREAVGRHRAPISGVDKAAVKSAMHRGLAGDDLRAVAEAPKIGGAPVGKAPRSLPAADEGARRAAEALAGAEARAAEAAAAAEAEQDLQVAARLAREARRVASEVEALRREAATAGGVGFEVRPCDVALPESQRDRKDCLVYLPARGGAVGRQAPGTVSRNLPAAGEAVPARRLVPAPGEFRGVGVPVLLG